MGRMKEVSSQPLCFYCRKPLLLTESDSFGCELCQSEHNFYGTDPLICSICGHSASYCFDKEERTIVACSNPACPGYSIRIVRFHHFELQFQDRSILLCRMYGNTKLRIVRNTFFITNLLWNKRIANNLYRFLHKILDYNNSIQISFFDSITDYVM